MDKKFEFEGRCIKTGEVVQGDLLHGKRGEMYICTVTYEEEIEMIPVEPESVSLIKGAPPESGRQTFGDGIPIW